jgi:hypothetical protein
MTKEEFRKEVFDELSKKPKEWRNGQFVFNYIDEKFKVARTVQFKYGIDCFYDDNEIENFINKSFDLIKDN